MVQAKRSRWELEGGLHPHPSHGYTRYPFDPPRKHQPDSGRQSLRRVLMAEHTGQYLRGVNTKTQLYRPAPFFTSNASCYFVLYLKFISHTSLRRLPMSGNSADFAILNKGASDLVELITD